MNKTLEKHLADSATLYTNVIFEVSKLEDFVDRDRFQERKFVSLLPILQKYIDLGNRAKVEDSGQNFFQKALNINNKEEEKAEKFRIDNADTFEQLKSCSTCKCLSCTSDCAMAGCNRCNKSGKVASCDGSKVCVWTFTDYKISLTDNNTGNEAFGSVKAVVQDVEYDQLFIIFDFLGEQYVQYFYPKTTGDDYGTIEDTEDFNFALGAFEKINL